MSGLRLRAVGTPQPEGSTKAFKHKTTGRVVVIADNRAPQLHWRGEVERAALEAAAVLGVALPYEGPVTVRALFLMPRGKTVRRDHHTVKPDADKLARAVGDALTAAKVYGDDAQVVEWHARKVYAPAGVEPGAFIQVSEFSPPVSVWDEPGVWDELEGAGE